MHGSWRDGLCGSAGTGENLVQSHTTVRKVTFGTRVSSMDEKIGEVS